MQTTLAAAVEETRSAVSSVTGQVRIAITDTVSEYLLPKVIAAIRRQLPLVAFEPVERNLRLPSASRPAIALLLRVIAVSLPKRLER